MRIYINKDDIKNGTPGYGYSCPITLAIKRRLKKSDIFVGPYGCRIGIKYYSLSKKTKIFIENVDRGNIVNPTHVTIIGL